MAQLWEHSPFSNVARVRFSDPVSYVGWVCGWFSSLLREVFLWVFPFSPLLKNQHFQIPIRSWIVRAFNFWTSSCELLSAPWVNRFHLHLHLHSNKSTPPMTEGMLECLLETTPKRQGAPITSATTSTSGIVPKLPCQRYWFHEKGSPLRSSSFPGLLPQVNAQAKAKARVKTNKVHGLGKWCQESLNGFGRTTTGTGSGHHIYSATSGDFWIQEKEKDRVERLKPWSGWNQQDPNLEALST